jgi:hypothetical protein
MTLYEQTVRKVRGLAQRARTKENALFCERRPLTSLEAGFAGLDDLARELHTTEDEALRALALLVESEQGYESALRSIDDAGADAAEWLREVMLSRALDGLRPG